MLTGVSLVTTGRKNRAGQCYTYDSERLLKFAKKPLARITLADLQSFARHLIDLGLAPISCVRTLAAVKSLFLDQVRSETLGENGD